MSSISSLNNASIISFHKGLSAYTKMRLEALGIDPSTVQTEMQAQAIIAQAEAAQKQQQGNTGQQQGGSHEKAPG